MCWKSTNQSRARATVLRSDEGQDLTRGHKPQPYHSTPPFAKVLVDAPSWSETSRAPKNSRCAMRDAHGVRPTHRCLISRLSPQYPSFPAQKPERWIVPHPPGSRTQVPVETHLIRRKIWQPGEDSMGTGLRKPCNNSNPRRAPDSRTSMWIRMSGTSGDRSCTGQTTLHHASGSTMLICRCVTLYNF